MYLFVFTLAELAIGYTFVPGKRGGLLLSGIPTIMIAMASLSLCFAALLTIVDHYDKRPNEHHYQSFKNRCYKSTVFLFLAAPFVELFEFILRYRGIGVFPDFHGFAANLTFYSPDLHRYISYLDPLVDMSLVIAIVSFSLLGVGGVLAKYFPGTSKRFSILLITMGMLGISYMVLMFTIKDFFVGEIEANGIMYRAISEPAKFNAVLLTDFILSVFFLLISLAGVVGIMSKRIKIINDV